MIIDIFLSFSAGLNSCQTIKGMAKITINALKNGPCIVNVDGKKVAALCRCGASSNKPHCDGAHAKSGFEAEESRIDI